MKRLAWLTFGLGMWLLVFAPFVLGVVPISTTPTVSHVLTGIALIILSFWILSALAPPVVAAWCCAACGVWLIISPFVLQYREFMAATVNDVAVGLIALAVGTSAAVGIARTPTPS